MSTSNGVGLHYIWEDVDAGCWRVSRRDGRLDGYTGEYQDQNQAEKVFGGKVTDNPDVYCSSGAGVFILQLAVRKRSLK